MHPPARSAAELARQFVRSFMPRKGYVFLSLAIDWMSALGLLGWRQTRRLWRANSKPTSNVARSLLTVESPNLSHPFCLRPGTTDVGEFLYTVVRESYVQRLPQGSVRFILDAGANNGDLAAWFLSRFQDAKLIAVEPDPENFSLLQRNCAPYGSRSFPVQAAVWPKSEMVLLSGDGDKDAVQVLESDHGDCQGLTVPELMTTYGFPKLDIFKCDIEGAELRLFSEDADRWLSCTGFLVIEVHGADCLSAVVGATARHGFTHREFRNLHIFERSGQSL